MGRRTFGAGIIKFNNNNKKKFECGKALLGAVDKYSSGSAKCGKITDMFATWAAGVSKCILPNNVEQQVELDGGKWLVMATAKEEEQTEEQVEVQTEE